MTRKIITDQIQIDQSGTFEGTIETVISNLARIQSEIVTQYPEAIDSDIKIEVDYYGYDGGRDYEVRFSRFETDEEMQAREKQEAKIKEVKKRKALAKEAEIKSKEIDERKLYEELKRKFGD
jgi:hypothetical protein